MDTFSNVGGCSFAYLNVIMSRHMNICYHLILLCIPTIFGGYIVFLEVALWSFNKLRNHVIYRNGVWEYKKTSYHKSSEIQEWYRFIRICFPTKFDDCSLRECCDITFLIYHVIMWSKVISPNGCVQFHPSHQIWFTCLFLKI